MLDLGIILTLASPYTVALIIPLVLWTSLKNEYRVYLTPYNFGLLGLFIWAGISGVLNRSWVSLFGSGIFLAYLLVNIYFQNRFNDTPTIETFLKKLHKYSLIPAAFGIMERMVSLFVDITWISRFFWSPTYIPDKAAYRIYSTFGNPNVAGDWFALLALISVYFLENAPYKKKGFYAFAMGIFIAALLFTGSKGSIIGLIIGLTIYAFFSNKKKTKWVIGLTILAIIGATFVLPEIHRASNYRNALWLKSLKLYKDHPLFGVGLMGIYERTGEIHSHNIWISFLGMLGVGGFGLYLGMKIYLYNGLIKIKRMGCRLLPLLAAIQALIAGHGMVDFTMISPQGGLLFIATSGLIAGLICPSEKYKSFPMKTPVLPAYKDLRIPQEIYQQINAGHRNTAVKPVNK